MTRRYSAARPVSDPVASRNATIKMIRECAKHQPWAQEFGAASRVDGFTAYTTWGVRAEADGFGFSPALSIKEEDDMYIQRLLYPTHPVVLVPPGWHYVNGEWQSDAVPVLRFELPPDVQWFSLSQQDPERWDTPPVTPVTPDWITEHVQRLIAQFMLPPGLLREPVPERERQLQSTAVHITFTEN